MVTMAATVNKFIKRDTSLPMSHFGRLASIVSVFCAAAYAPVAQGIDWRFEPSVGATTTYTDNVRQSASNTEDALILGITPGFSLRSHGSRRIQASLQYGLSGITRLGGGDENDLFHNLSAIGKAEIVEDFLYLDGSANISQELISLLGSGSDASTNSSNRATVGTYSLSPNIKKRLGSFATAQARYTTSGAIFGNNAASNSNANALSAGVASGPRFNDLNWRVDYSIRKVNNQDVGDSTFERIGAQLGYAISRQFRIFGTVGLEKNDYLSSTKTDGSSYSMGFGWSPTRRTSVEASVGERYFGRTFSFSGNHRTRISRWNIRYSEDVSDITQQFLEQGNRVFWICGGSLIETPDAAPPVGQTCSVGPISAGQLAQTYASFGVPLSELIAAGLLNVASANGVFIIKSLTAGVSWDVGRLGFGLSAQDTRRLYQVLSNAEDHIQSVSGTASYRMTPQTTANTSLSLTRSSFDPALAGGSARTDDTLSLSVGVNHRFADKLSGALTVRHIQRDSNAANAGYDENSISATANMRF